MSATEQAADDDFLECERCGSVVPEAELTDVYRIDGPGEGLDFAGQHCSDCLEYSTVKWDEYYLAEDSYFPHAEECGTCGRSLPANGDGVLDMEADAYCPRCWGTCAHCHEAHPISDNLTQCEKGKKWHGNLFYCHVCALEILDDQNLAPSIISFLKKSTDLKVRQKAQAVSAARKVS